MEVTSLSTQALISFWVVFVVGLALIVGTYLVTKSTNALWGLVSLVFMLRDITHPEYPTPFALGGLGYYYPILAMFVAVLGFNVIFFLILKSKNVAVLWGVVAINLIVNLFV